MRRWTWTCMALAVIGCGAAVDGTGTDGDDGSSTGSSTTPTDPTPGTTMTMTGATTSPGTTTSPPPTSSTTIDPDTGSDSGSSGTGNPIACDGEGCALDILVVVDNSVDMARAQTELARSLVTLEATLRALEADVHVMFTTTDYSNPLCTPFEPKGYDPAQGSPISTACTERLDDFTSLGGDMDPGACTAVCPEAVAPLDDPFVAFDARSDNLPELLPPRDVDGDGQDDPPAAQAMACLAPMGLNGCGYESPLESMLAALNPAAPWNSGNNPFLRDDAALGIVILSNEADCSLADPALMQDQTYMETNPDSQQAEASSAMCWNAGVTCSGPDAMGVYANCQPSGLDLLHPVERYENYLVDVLRERMGKAVSMVGILGLASVTEHSAEPPYAPIEGGLEDTVFRNWREDDVLPDEAMEGTNAADKQFLLGIGPGCTAPESTTSRQAVPDVRMTSVCNALNLGDDPADARCCLESICDPSYDDAMRCLSGTLLGEAR